MNNGVRLLVYSVKDIAKTRELYRKFLGVDPYVGAPYYVGFRVGDVEIGLDPNGYKQGQTGPISY